MINRVTFALIAALTASACSKSTSKHEEGAYTSASGHYKVRFPHGAHALEEDKPDPNKLHGDVTWHHAKSDLGAYAIMYTDFKDAQTAQQDIDDYQTIMKDRMTSAKDITIAGHPGREVEMRISDTATMWIRLVHVDKREYRISAGTKNNSALAHEFLDSFELQH